MGGQFIFLPQFNSLLFCGPIPAGVSEKGKGWRAKERIGSGHQQVFFCFVWLLKIMIYKRAGDRVAAGCCTHSNGLDFSQDDKQLEGPNDWMCLAVIGRPLSSQTDELQLEWVGRLQIEFFWKLTALWRSCCEGFHVALKHRSYSVDNLNQIDWFRCRPAPLGLRDQSKLCQITALHSSAFVLSQKLLANVSDVRWKAWTRTVSQLQLLVMEVNGLYSGATNLQGAGCVTSCTTSSVLVKWTDKNIFGECGALENKPSKHKHTHTDLQMHTRPQLGLHNVSAHITIFHIRTHTPVRISDGHLFLPHINTPTITILVCFMPLLCSLSQILQYLCVQQYFNKEYQNWCVQALIFFAFGGNYSF